MERWAKLQLEDLIVDLEIKRGLSHSQAESVAYQTLFPQTASRWQDTFEHEVSLEDEYRRQAAKLAKLFATFLGISEAEYILSISPFPEKPRTYKFDSSSWRPLIVEGNRIPWAEQARLSGIGVDMTLASTLADVQDSPFRKTPEAVYSTWIKITRYYNTFSENGATIVEGIAFWNSYQDKTRDGIFDFPGSVASLNEIPYLNCQSWLFGRPFLGSYNRGDLWRPRCHSIISSTG